jgi:ABC-type uncharacterized transport system ATPase subunit
MPPPVQRLDASVTAEPLLEFDKLVVRFGGFVAFNGISLKQTPAHPRWRRHIVE